MLTPPLYVIVWVLVTVTVASTAAIYAALLGYERSGPYWLSVSVIFVVLETV